MSEYQRFISYIYAYDGGIKVKNVGFAKMEVRNGRCRIGINLKGAYGSSGKEGVYAVRRIEDGLEKLCLGEIVLSKGSGEFSYVSEENRVGGAPCGLKDLCGLYLGGEAGERFYFTGWDDRPVNMEELTAGRAQEEAEAETAAGREPEDVPAAPEAVREEEPEEETCQVSEAGEDSGHSEEVRAAEYSQKRCPFFTGKPRPAEQAEEKRETASVPGDPEEEAWELLCRVYPKMLPAPGQEAWEILEIHLQDIGRLPRKNWIYGNNSFLIQGYYRYGHLMLARRENNGKIGYWLGVPGSRDDTEKLLAAMFGFRKYLPGNRRRSENFGYWCVEIPLKGDGFLIDKGKRGKTVDSAACGAIQKIGGRRNEPEGV